MLQMEYKFKHSLVVMGQLARDTARTPPSEDDSPLEYVDRSLTILGRTFDAYNQRMRQEFLSQREFTASQFRGVEKKIEEVEKKMDRRFEEVEKKMDRRFEEVEKKMDRRFEEVEKKIDKQEGEIRDIKVQVENAAAITRNGRLRRMHQPINLIKVLKPTADLNEFVWTSHPQVPKHIKNVYILGQRAKGIFEPSWDKTPNEQKPYAKRRALNIIESLAKFYNVVLYSDEESESDATEVILQDWNVDDCMEALLDEWGMDWQMVLNFGRQHIQPQPQQAGAKRTGNASSREEKKKAREGGQEKVD
ncbi:hypothetical protein N7G274_006848 [Stereocaulon virgatum]|uniref:Uncharacterized protein n=1 Tax=Stereocaulon virgatum TaxID=373712 RepID=A0ABR4A4Q8_9LECA